MYWYRDVRIQTAGITLLALLAAQVLQIVLFVIVSTIHGEISQLDPRIMSLLTLLPAILGILAGGAFLGRLRPDNTRVLWTLSAIVAALFPLVVQAIIVPGAFDWLAEVTVWISAAGSGILWFVGCYLGGLSYRKKPDPVFDRSLLRWTGGILAALFLLYSVTWGSMVFSKGYRMAKSVDLLVPPDVEEINLAYLEPGIAKSRHFKTVIPSGDTHIQEFYAAVMSNDGWIDVTDVFQEWPLKEWRTRQEIVNNLPVEYVLSGGHWQDLSGKVAVTMVLQGQKVQESLSWDETDWLVYGIILS